MDEVSMNPTQPQEIPALSIPRVVVSVKALTDFVIGVDALVDEALIEVNPDGINVMAMDPSSVSMVKAFMPLAVKSNFKFGVDVPALKKILVAIDSNKDEGDLELTLKDDKKIILTYKDTVAELNTIDVKKSVQKEPKVDFNTKFYPNAKAFRDGLKLMDKVSSYVTLSSEADSQKLKLYAKGDSGTLMTMMQAEIYSVREGNTAVPNTTYNLEFLTKMVKASSLSKDKEQKIALHINHNEPILISYKIADLSLSYWLAPYLEE